MFKVSVIVPVYNVEKYLHKCIEYIINQTLSSIEIILIDDGSTERTYKYGHIERTGNLMKCMDEYFIKTQNEILAKKILPIILLFFHKWNISQIKTYSKEDIATLIID